MFLFQNQTTGWWPGQRIRDDLQEAEDGDLGENFVRSEVSCEHILLTKTAERKNRMRFRSLLKCCHFLSSGKVEAGLGCIQTERRDTGRTADPQQRQRWVSGVVLFVEIVCFLCLRDPAKILPKSKSETDTPTMC